MEKSLRFTTWTTSTNCEGTEFFEGVALLVVNPQRRRLGVAYLQLCVLGPASLGDPKLVERLRRGRGVVGYCTFPSLDIFGREDCCNS
jgi:hypothetical protein